MVQRLEFNPFTARGLGLIPSLGTKIPEAIWSGKEKKEKNIKLLCQEQKWHGKKLFAYLQIREILKLLSVLQ